ncbi:helix-turn-helix domain-containing protein [Microbulbifer sp. THAF38]|uniref:helix-turn-helix domain-containing protein n=1 Tax=Microbulbifer sp. THAF38 TaxID=2587856 RepID=UPI00126897E8|nr:AraC family transcriptional regulator [Microbulbifer sp. THAF38]QFT54866.1 Helix-turn-helix domain protein [Microbulbifer sp. THAF38]
MINDQEVFSSPLFLLAADRLRAHTLPSTCLLCGLDGPIVLKYGAKQVVGDILLVRPQVLHEVIIEGRARILNLNGLQFPYDSDLAIQLTNTNYEIAIDALWGEESSVLELRAKLGYRQVKCPTDIAQIITHLSDEPMFRMSQQELAIRLNRERTQALKYFKASTGMTFRGLKLWLAIQSAAHQLLTGDLVRNAALDNGFADTAHFTRSFRTALGITPSEAIAGYHLAMSLSSR